MSDQKYTEMLSIREYTVGKIIVTIKVDRRAKTASLVEWNTRTQEYEAKEYVFKDRTAGYVATWLKIMGAMSTAIKEVLAELEQIEQDELEKTAKLAAALQEEEEKRK